MLTNLHLDLQSSWTKKRLINHVDSVGHPNQQNIVKLLHPINLAGGGGGGGGRGEGRGG